MAALLDTVDPDGLLEYSVVFTDRSLNHMSNGDISKKNPGTDNYMFNFLKKF